MADAPLLTRTKDPDAPAHFTFEGIEAAPFEGRMFGILADTCLNPLCDCKELYLYFFPDVRMAADNSAFWICADVAARNTSKGGAKGHSPEAAQLLVQHLSPDDWAQLHRVWEGRKAALIEQITPSEAAKMDYPFVGDEITTMAGFKEVFPGSLWFVAEYEGQPLAAVDMYCVNPACVCTDTVWSFFAEGQPKKPVFSLEYNYRTSRIGYSQTKGIGLQEAATIIEQVKATHPDLDQKLAHRNQVLRAMRSKSLLSHPRSLAKRSAPVSRNAPCPCGSGKKYKHCCGA